MALKAVMSCEGLSSFTAGGFELKRALTRLPLENTTCPRFTLGPRSQLQLPFIPKDENPLQSGV